MSGSSDLPPARFNRSQDHNELYLKLIRWELDDEMQNVLQKLQNWTKRKLTENGISLFDLIGSVNYINLSIDTGRSDIVLLPYSINVAQGNLCNQSTSQSSVSLCNGDSVLIGSNIYTAGGFYTDTLNIDGGCDSIIYTNIIVNFNTFSFRYVFINFTSKLFCKFSVSS